MNQRPIQPHLALFAQEIEARRRQCLEQIDRVPVAVLFWGPSPALSSPTAVARSHLKDVLASNGHLADFSEDLVDDSSNRSLLAQQIAQAEAYDIVFSIPDSTGSVAEIHDFARIPDLSHKIVTFLNAEHNAGYSNQTLIRLRSTASTQVQLYDPAQLPHCIVDEAIKIVHRLQENYYMAGRR